MNSRSSATDSQSKASHFRQRLSLKVELSSRWLGLYGVRMKARCSGWLRQPIPARWMFTKPSLENDRPPFSSFLTETRIVPAGRRQLNCNGGSHGAWRATRAMRHDAQQLTGKMQGGHHALHTALLNKDEKHAQEKVSSTVEIQQTANCPPRFARRRFARRDLPAEVGTQRKVSRQTATFDVPTLRDAKKHRVALHVSLPLLRCFTSVGSLHQQCLVFDFLFEQKQCSVVELKFFRYNELGSVERLYWKTLQLVAEGDSNQDGTLDFKEFASWVLDHEEQLSQVFRKIDKKMDGYIDAAEIKEAFSQLGISIDDGKAEMLVKRMDMEGNLLISEAEWKEFLLLQAGRSLDEIACYWEHTLMGTLNTGDEAQIPDDFSAEQLRSGQALNMLFSGGLAGALSRTCTAPLDRLKVLRQVYGYQHAGSSAIKAFRWMLQEGGIRSLWRGNGVNVIKIAPETAIKYTFYDFYKRLLFGGPSELQIHQKFLAGSLAGATSQTMIYPMEVAKTRMCLRKTGQYPGGLVGCLASVYREGGTRALFRGYTINLAGILPYAGIELAAYETTRTWLFRDLPSHEAPSVAALLLSGALASSIGIVACYPLALLRTKMQSKVQFSRPELNTVRGLAATVYQAEGIVGFYRGMGANLV
uniref:EF-hand domain-containing protein n=1 Tax=Macrostomum lignano TaxID=282301 RepID=A0A1I8IGT4_9PLAT